MRQFEIQGKHTYIVGRTQSGKTYFSKWLADRFDGGVLFINPQKEKLRGYIKTDMNNDKADIYQELKKKSKINYIPSIDDKEAAKELKLLTDYLFSRKIPKFQPILFVIDETHIFSNDKESKRALKTIANRGLSYGINALFISQRFANVEYTTVTQSDQHFIFKIGFEREYFTRKGLDYDEIIKKIDKNGKYSFVLWNGINLTGPFKI